MREPFLVRMYMKTLYFNFPGKEIAWVRMVGRIYRQPNRTAWWHHVTILRSTNRSAGTWWPSEVTTQTYVTVDLIISHCPIAVQTINVSVISLSIDTSNSDGVKRDMLAISVHSLHAPRYRSGFVKSSLALF